MEDTYWDHDLLSRATFCWLVRCLCAKNLGKFLAVAPFFNPGFGLFKLISQQSRKVSC